MDGDTYVYLAEESGLDLADFGDILGLLAPLFYVHRHLSDLLCSFPERFVILGGGEGVSQRQPLCHGGERRN
mgnify:CR=1 FL=1